jgi:hypothetical protein
MILRFSLTVGILLVAGFFCPSSQAQTASKVDRVIMKEDKPNILEQGKRVPLAKDLQLSDILLVSTNGTFTVKKGKPRKLQDGQILGKDGMLTSPDGRLEPVIDHVVMEGGRLVLYKDGQSSILNGEFVLPNGARIATDGTLKSVDGQTRRFIEGQMIELDGTMVPSKDTVTLRKGVVFVQKEGNQFEIKPAQTIMMNEGTKVFGNGLVLKRDGTRIQLAEGQVLTLDGVEVYRR